MVGNEEMNELEKNGQLGQKDGGWISKFCCERMLGVSSNQLQLSNGRDSGDKAYAAEWGQVSQRNIPLMNPRTVRKGREDASTIHNVPYLMRPLGTVTNVANSKQQDG
ncbi:hypothetical protein MMC14_010616 [Varicellaria rhodocarpa]|nr:hypothetical protein [Varicellaria rhodocarpa]